MKKIIRNFIFTASTKGFISNKTLLKIYKAVPWAHIDYEYTGPTIESIRKRFRDMECHYGGASFPEEMKKNGGKMDVSQLSNFLSRKN